MASTSETVKDVCDFFKEILLTKDGGPIAFYNLRAFATKAPPAVEEFVKKKCKGENLLRYFQKHPDYFLVEKLNVSLKADKFPQCPKERKLEENRKVPKNVNTDRMSSKSSHSKSCLSNDSKQNCSHEEVIEYELITKKYFSDYLMKHSEIILKDLDLEFLPKKVRRFLVKHAGKDISAFFLGYPDLFFVDKGRVWPMFQSSAEREAWSADPATDDANKSGSASNGAEISVESAVQAFEESVTSELVTDNCENRELVTSEDASSLSSFKTASDGCPSPCNFLSVSEESLPSSEMGPDSLSSNAVDDLPRDSASNKDTFEHLINCYYVVNFICFEIIEREEDLHLTCDYKAVKYFADIIKKYCINDLKFLQGKLGQADADMLQFMRQLYKGDKIKDFFMKHQEFDFDASWMSVYLSDDYEIHLKNTASAKKSETYLGNLRDPSWSKLCSSIFEGLYQMSTFMENKKKVALSRLSGRISSMQWFLDNIHRLDGKDPIEKLHKLISRFSFFMPVGENNYILNDEVKDGFFIPTLQKLSQELTKEEQNAIILQAHGFFYQENCAVVSFCKSEALKLKIVELVDCSLNDIECVSYSVLPQILGTSILHNAFHLSFWCPVIIRILVECGKFIIENGQIRKKKERNQTISIGGKSGTSNEISPVSTSNQCIEKCPYNCELPGTDSFTDTSSEFFSGTSQMLPESLTPQNEPEACGRVVEYGKFKIENGQIRMTKESHPTISIGDKFETNNEISPKCTSNRFAEECPDKCELPGTGSFTDTSSDLSSGFGSEASEMVPEFLTPQNESETCEIAESSFCKSSGFGSGASEMMPESLTPQNEPETCEIAESSFCNDADVESLDDRKVVSNLKISRSTLDKDMLGFADRSESNVRVSLLKLLIVAVKKSDQSGSKIHMQSNSVEDQAFASDSTCSQESSVDQKAQNSSFFASCEEKPSIDLLTECESEEYAAVSEILPLPALLPDCYSPNKKAGLRKSFDCLISCYYSVQYFCLVFESKAKAREDKAVKFFVDVLISDSGGTCKSSLKSLQRKISKADSAVCHLMRNDYPGKSFKNFFINQPEFVFNSSELSVQLSQTYSDHLKERPQISHVPVKSKQCLENICGAFWANSCASTFGLLANLAKVLKSVKNVSFDYLCEFLCDFEQFPYLISRKKEICSDILMPLLRAFKIFTPLQNNKLKLSDKACEANEQVFYYPLAMLGNLKSEEEQNAVIKTVHDTHLSMCYSSEFLNYDDLCIKVIEHVNFRLYNSTPMSIIELPWVLGEYILHSAYHLSLKHSDLVKILLDCDLFDWDNLDIKRKESNQTSKHNDASIPLEKYSIKSEEPIVIKNEISEKYACNDFDLKYDSCTIKEQGTVSDASAISESVKCAIERDSYGFSTVPCDLPLPCDTFKEKNLVLDSHDPSCSENIRIPLLKVLSHSFKKFPKPSISSKDSSLNKEQVTSTPNKDAEVDHGQKAVDNAPSTASSVKRISERKKKKKPLCYVVPQPLPNNLPSEEKCVLRKGFEYLLECFFTAHFSCFQVLEREMSYFEQIEHKAVKFFVDTLKLMPGYKGSLKQLKRKLRKADADVINCMKFGPMGFGDKFFTHYKEFVFNPSNTLVSLSEDYETQLEKTAKPSSPSVRSKEYLNRLCSLSWAELCAQTFQWLLRLAKLLTARDKVKLNDLSKNISMANVFLGKVLDGEDRSEQLKTVLKSFKCITCIEDECFSWNEEVKMPSFFIALNGLQDKYSEQQQIFVLQSAHTMFHDNCPPEKFLGRNELSFKVLEHLKFKLHEVSSLRYSELPHVFGAYLLHSAFHLSLFCSDLIWIIWDSGLFDIYNGIISRKRESNFVVSNEKVVNTPVLTKLVEVNSTEEEKVAFSVIETSEKILSNDDSHGKISDKDHMVKLCLIQDEPESSALCQEKNICPALIDSTSKDIRSPKKAVTPVLLNSSPSENSKLDNSNIGISDALKTSEVKKPLHCSELSHSQIPISSSKIPDAYIEPKSLMHSLNVQNSIDVCKKVEETSVVVHVDVSNESKDIYAEDSGSDIFKDKKSISNDVSDEEFDIFKFALDVEKRILDNVIKESLFTESADSEDYSLVTPCAVVQAIESIDDRPKVPSSDSTFQQPDSQNAATSPLNYPRAMDSANHSQETSSDVFNRYGNQDDLPQSASQNCFPEKSSGQNQTSISNILGKMEGSFHCSEEMSGVFSGCVNQDDLPQSFSQNYFSEKSIGENKNSNSDILAKMNIFFDCSENHSSEKDEVRSQHDKLQLLCEKKMNSVSEKSLEQNESLNINLLTERQDSFQYSNEKVSAIDTDQTKSNSPDSNHLKLHSSNVCMNNLTEKRCSSHCSEEAASVTVDEDHYQDDLKSPNLHSVPGKALQKNSIFTMNHDPTFLQPLKAKVMLMSTDICIAKYLVNSENLLMFCLKPTFHCDEHNDSGECFKTIHVGDTVLCYLYDASSNFNPGKVLFPYMFCRDQESIAPCCQGSKTSGGLRKLESCVNEYALLDSQKVSSGRSDVHPVNVRGSDINAFACDDKDQSVLTDEIIVSKSTSCVQTDIVLQENSAQTEIGGTIKPCFATLEKAVNATCTFLSQETQASSELSESGSQTILSDVLKRVEKQSQTCIVRAHKHVQTATVQTSNSSQTSISGSVKPDVESCPSACQTGLSGDVKSCPQSATASCQTISLPVPVISQFVQTAPQSLSVAQRFSISVDAACVINQSVQCEPSSVETAECSICTDSPALCDSVSQTLSTGAIMVMDYLP